jgi:hypothetical protein
MLTKLMEAEYGDELFGLLCLRYIATLHVRMLYDCINAFPFDTGTAFGLFAVRDWHSLPLPNFTLFPHPGKFCFTTRWNARLIPASARSRMG